MACATLMLTAHETSIPSREKKRSGSTWKLTIRSPASAPPLPRGPCPLRRIFEPLSVPGGTVIITRFSTRTSPAPAQVPQRWDAILPLPRHAGHGRLTENPPCPKETVPVPWHSPQVARVAPAAAPDPPHVGHASVTGTMMGTLPPSAATRSGIETTVSTLSPRSAPPRLFRSPPKIEEKRSPSPPMPPRSPRSISSKRMPPPVDCADGPPPERQRRPR